MSHPRTTRRYMRQFAKRLRDLSHAVNRNHYEMGKLLYEALEGRYWEEWHGCNGMEAFASWSEWAYDVVGYTKRKAQYLVRNYTELQRLKVVEESADFDRLMGLGWSKLDLVLRLSPNRREMRKWLGRVERERLGKRHLRVFVRALASADRVGLTQAGKIHPLWRDLARILAVALEKAEDEQSAGLTELLTQAQSAVKQLA